MILWNDVLKLAKSNYVYPDKVVKAETEWQNILTPEQFYITRKQGTESPHSSEMCYRFEPGLYSCICCDTMLFDASQKFDSGTGWPSFTQPIKPEVIAYHQDDSILGRPRIEVTCNCCDAHLGHVFPDGPAPSGLRYCINAVCLQKK